jgi:hypothetical protein
MNVNLEFDPSALSAPAWFRQAVQTAANILSKTFTDPITVNIAVGYGEVTASGPPTTLTSGEAEGAALVGDYIGYTTVHSALLAQLSPAVVSGAAALPSGAAILGTNQVAVWSAEEKALGLWTGDNTTLDGAVGFATDITASELVGAALHEMTHAMGRTVDGGGGIPDVFDLYRFTGSGARLQGYGDVSSHHPSPNAYFSLDGGATDLADYGTTSDSSDFLTTSTPGDSFAEYYNSATQQTLSPLDILQMEALGFHTSPPRAQADFNNDGMSDLFWASGDGTVATWFMNGEAVQGAQVVGYAPGWTVQDVGDFDGDGHSGDVLFRNGATGQVAIWLENGSQVTAAGVISQLTPAWQIMGAADFDGDGRSDVLLRNESTGEVGIWLMNGLSIQSAAIPAIVSADWHIVGAADFNGDGRADILWQSASTGQLALWEMNGVNEIAAAVLGALPQGWTVAGTGDFNGDGHADILLDNRQTGQVGIWEMSGFTKIAAAIVGTEPAEWQIAGVADVNGDGMADIIWRDATTSQVAVWEMNGLTVASAGLPGLANSSWGLLNHHFDWV